MINKKMISILLTAGMVVSLAGCGGDSKKSKDGGDNKQESANVNKEGMPIVDDPVTLTVLTTRWGNMGDSFEDNAFLKKLEKDSNVTIKWEVQSLNDWGEQKGILLSGGELPDVIIGNKTFGDSDIIGNLDMFLPLDDLIHDYMPNYKKAMEEFPELRKISTFPDGKLYSLAKNLPQRPMSRNQPIINKKWLDNLGLKEPSTIDELTEVLRAFKEQDANGNGDPNDEIPISGSGDVNMDFMNPFGITDLSGYKLIMTGDSSFEYYPTSENYKEGIKWLHSLYEGGIIDPEAYTQDETMLSGKEQDPDVSRVGMTYAWTPDARYGKWSPEYEAIPPIKGPDGKAYTEGDPDGVYSITRNEAIITTACKNPEAAARWLDEFYTGEASIQNFWGPIGEVIEKHDDGTYTLNDPPEGTSADAWYWEKSLRDFGPKYISREFESKIKLSPDSGDGLKMELTKMADDTVVKPFPGVIFSPEADEERATLITDIDKFVQNKRAEWVTDGGIDKEWDDYVEQLNTMGLEKLLKIYQDALEEYQEK